MAYNQRIRWFKSHVHLVRGSIGVMASTMIASLTGWLFWVDATRVWPDSQIGVSTSLIAALTVIALIAGQPIATTLLARLPPSTDRRQLLKVSCLLAVGIAVALSLLAVAALPESLSVVRTPGMAVSFTIGSIVMSLGVVLDAAAIAIRRPRTMVARNGSFGVGKLLLLGVLSLFFGKLTAPFAVVVAWSVMAVLSAAWATRAIFRATSDHALLSTDEAVVSRLQGRTQLRAGYGAQVLGSLGGSLPPQIFPLIVIGVLGSTKSSWFSITWLLGGLCFMISPAVSSALLADASHSPNELAAKTRFATIISLLVLTGPVLIYIFAGRFVLGFFGPSYRVHGTTLLVILAISAFPDLVTNIGVARYRVLNRLWVAAIINLVIATVAVGGSIVLLPKEGIDGAGWAWMIGQLAGCLVLAAILVANRRSIAKLTSTKSVS